MTQLPHPIPRVFPPTLAPDESVGELAKARADADARYNQALSAVDAALLAVRDAPHPPPPPDETQVTPLNERWRVVPDAPPVAGNWLQRKVAGLAWRVVAPALERQQAFNAALVDHVNRSVPVDRATREAIEAALRFTSDALGELRAFHSALIVYFQQLTGFVDTKDFEFAGHIRDRYIALDGAVAGLTDEILKRWESMVAREQRFDAKATAIGAAQAESSREFRDAIAVLHQATIALKREVERIGTTGQPAFAGPGVGAPPPDAASARHAPSTTAGSATHGRFGAWKYVGFEDRFRGSREEIRSRLEAYVPIFRGASDVLDIGCGRGEFLNLLREHGIGGRGLDLNHEMVEVCRTQGLEAVEGDALGYLRSLPDQSLGGMFAAQVAEHLEPDYLLRAPRGGVREAAAGVGDRARDDQRRRAGSPSSPATSATSRTSGRCIPTRSATCSRRTASRKSPSAIPRPTRSGTSWCGSPARASSRTRSTPTPTS